LDGTGGKKKDKLSRVRTRYPKLRQHWKTKPEKVKGKGPHKLVRNQFEAVNREEGGQLLTRWSQWVGGGQER